YKLADQPPTPVATLQEARRIGREVGLHYIYIGNVPGEGEDTYCPACGKLVLKRIGFKIKENRLQEGGCPSCGAVVDGVWFTP
ncbi:MAG TPA: radical SAM protein, partial [Candidatus Heimdallarchaeota archaeon]|nr:radical SAM protein [Candidatus Heimdallarchaeota archaeon]